MVPWLLVGKKADPQFLGPLLANPRWSGSTTNVGRFSFIAAQCIADPGTHPGKTGPLESGRLQISRLAVDACFAGHVVDERDVVDARAERLRRLR